MLFVHSGAVSSCALSLSLAVGGCAPGPVWCAGQDELVGEAIGAERSEYEGPKRELIQEAASRRICE